VTLEAVGNGVYRSAHPFPVGGSWSTAIRLHVDRGLLAVPISLPQDNAIPAPAVSADDRFTRPFIADRLVVLRESVKVPPGLEGMAYLVSAFLCAVMVAALVVVLRRLDVARRQAAASSSRVAARDVSRGDRRRGGR
jgi:hypothetical protein